MRSNQKPQEQQRTKCEGGGSALSQPGGEIRWDNLGEILLFDILYYRILSHNPIYSLILGFFL